MIIDYPKMGTIGGMVLVVDRRTGEPIDGCYRANDAVGVVRRYLRDEKGLFRIAGPRRDRIADTWEHRDIRIVPHGRLDDDAREVVRRRIEEPEAFARSIPWIVLEYEMIRPRFLWLRPKYRWRARWDDGGKSGAWFPSGDEAAFDLLWERSRGRLGVRTKAAGSPDWDVELDTTE